MFESKFKKEVGFIKGQSSKKNLIQKDQSPHDSSDSFSSFEYDPVSRKEQFSPYRHPIDPIANKKPSKDKDKQASYKNKEKRGELEQPKFTNLVLRNNFIKDGQSRKVDRKSNVQEEINQINKKISQVKSRIINQKPQDGFGRTEQAVKVQQQNKYLDEEEQLSLSNINRFQKAQESSLSQPLQKQLLQKNPKTLAQYKKYLQQSSQQEEQEQEQRQHYKKTVSHKENIQRNRNEELITEWDKRQFKDKNIKTAIIAHNKDHPKKCGDKFVQSKGGLYFEVDKKQFKADTTKNTVYPKKKKKIEVSTREQLIIRRETAKRYDREVRHKLFGYA